MTVGLEELLPVIDRVVQPIAERMGRMETKLDQALAQKEDIAVQQAAQQRTDARLAELETTVGSQSAKLNRAEGRNTIINWILGLVGAPIVVALAAAGIAKFMGLVP